MNLSFCQLPFTLTIFWHGFCTANFGTVFVYQNFLLNLAPVLQKFLSIRLTFGIIFETIKSKKINF